MRFIAKHLTVRGSLIFNFEVLLLIIGLLQMPIILKLQISYYIFLSTIAWLVHRKRS